MTVAVMAIMAVAALRTYNRSMANQPSETQSKIVGIRQSTAVVLAIGEAVWAVLDALISLTRSRQSSAGVSGSSGSFAKGSFGGRVAADVNPEG